MRYVTSATRSVTLLLYVKCHQSEGNFYLAIKHTFLDLKVSVSAGQEQRPLAIFYRTAGFMWKFNCRCGQNHQC
ncbi:hypothetical protein PoB_002930000 [Plakobranchus ocellatus]|uniref:Secreted protein n=1 Tax=Plakobranchus ocellatus TaxID=259542 RepID=A0AAV4A5Z0_9GAST|nr:hypothetical protein PoB_002930000 [Plakobranchus ocellatus]